MISTFRVVSAAAVAVLVLGLSADGRASPRGGSRILLVTPGDAASEGGSAVVRPLPGHRGERMRLRVRMLEGSSEYLVKDRVRGVTLGSFRTGPTGAGRLRLSNSTPDGFSGSVLEIVDPGDGEVVLEGEDPVPDMHASGACAPSEGTVQDGHHADHHAPGSDHHDGTVDPHWDPGAYHHGTADPGSGGDVHDAGSMHGNGGHM